MFAAICHCLQKDVGLWFLKVEVFIDVCLVFFSASAPTSKAPPNLPPGVLLGNPQYIVGQGTLPYFVSIEFIFGKWDPFWSDNLYCCSQHIDDHLEFWLLIHQTRLTSVIWLFSGFTAAFVWIWRLTVTPAETPSGKLCFCCRLSSL